MSTPPSLGALSSSERTLQTQSDDDDGTAAAIAAGVTVPVVVILLIVGIVYWYYRKKYPVRMIVGRDFAKFSNPAYSRRQSQPHTLVREDADSFFQQTQPTGPISLVLGENDEEAKISYVNAGFQYDSQDADEEEVERRFRQQKAYLFKKHDDQDVGHGEENTEEGKTESAKATKKKKSKVNGQVRRDQGHENAAFSGDSDAEDEDAVDGVEPADKKNKTDSGSVSSDVSSASKKAGKAVSSEDYSLQEIPDTLPDTGQHPHAGMTVRDFLQMAREKRASSDAHRTRADIPTTFDFDIKKSARRRAQSAGDIWTSAVQSFPVVSREELVLTTTGLTPSSEGTELPDDANTVGIHENLTNVPYTRKSTGDIREISQSDDISQVAQPESHIDVDMEEDEKSVKENGMEESYFIADKISASGSNETPSHAKEDENNTERNRSDSSTSDGSFEKVASSQVSNLQSSVHDVDTSSAQSQQKIDGESSQDEETEVTASSPERVSCQEDDYVKVDRPVQQSSLPVVLDASRGLAQSIASRMSDDDNDHHMRHSAEGTNESSKVIVDLDSVHTANDNVDGSAFLSVSASSGVGTAMDESDTLSFETIEEFPHDKHSSDHDPDEAENGSPSSSVVMLDKNDVDNSEARDDESDGGSFKAGTSSFGEKLSVEEDFDRVSHDLYNQHAKDLEQEGVLSFGSSDQRSSTGRENRPSSVQIIPSMTYSDHSSLSSNDGDEPKKDESADASRQHEPQSQSIAQSLSHHAILEDEEESMPSQRTLTTDSRLSSDTGQSLQPAARSGSEQAHGTEQETRSPPQPSRLRGLAALRLHPNVKRASESESEGVELTTEDIQQVLEGSDDSSDEHHGPQPHQVIPSKNPVKIEPTEKFVFSEEDDEDFDV